MARAPGQGPCRSPAEGGQEHALLGREAKDAIQTRGVFGQTDHYLERSLDLKELSRCLLPMFCPVFKTGTELAY